MHKIFKVLITILLIVVMLFCSVILVGCNAQLIDTNYKFNYVHLYETDKCYKVKSWRDFEDGDQLQITLEDGTVMLVHSTDCALLYLKDDAECPFCDDK